jgi:hypothetical protein
LDWESQKHGAKVRKLAKDAAAVNDSMSVQLGDLTEPGRASSFGGDH